MKIGSLAGSPISETAPDKLFFAGGGGSVRGYAYRNIGVDHRDHPGHRRPLAGRGFGRGPARVSPSIGVAVFVDAGYVGADSIPGFRRGPQIGVGGGLRYYTGLGPIRLDVAVPLEPQRRRSECRLLCRNRTSVLTRLLFALFCSSPSLPAFAQDSEEADRSYFVGFVENQLSTPNRQIRISGIQGVLSSNAIIASITIADSQGVWLKITNARIVWTRSALLPRPSRHRHARRRQHRCDPQAASGRKACPLPKRAASRLPQLPLSINLGKLDVPRVTFGEDVFGLGSAISVDGRLSLVDGSLTPP